MNLTLKPSGNEHLKLKCDMLLTFAFKFNLRRYTPAPSFDTVGWFARDADTLRAMVGRCRLTLSNPL